ncbi:MAG: hypothetical protein HY902_03505 [Deltaproteobacteria bacterium]|nr:hypothetical protein [Deltaproteobacteria bacterium]
MNEHAEIFTASGLDERQFELIVLLADGELAAGSPERTAAEALLAEQAEAKQLYDNLTYSRDLLREAVLGEQAAAELKVDLSMLRGRVMSKLPAEPRPVPIPGKAAPSWLDWLRAFGFGRAGLAVAALAVVVVWWAGSQPTATPTLAPEPAAMARQDATMPPGHEEEPAVIIEEMDVEDGSIAVNPGDRPGATTVIWHFSGKGEG